MYALSDLNATNLDLLERQVARAAVAYEVLPARQEAYDEALALLQDATTPGQRFRRQEHLRRRLDQLNEVRRAAGLAEVVGPRLLSVDELLGAA